MKFWVLVIAAVALLVWSLVRERFEATPSIKAPPYDAAEKRRIFDMVRQRSATPPYSFLGYQDILMDKAKQLLPNETNQDKLKEAAGGIVAPAIESFFTTVFKPATTPITKEQVNTFVDGRASDIKMIEKDILTTYFVGQSGVGTSGQGGSNAYAAALAALGQNAGYMVTGSGSSGSTGSSGTGSGSTGSSGAGSGSAGSGSAGSAGSGSSSGSAGSGAGAGAGNVTGASSSSSSAASVTSDEWEEGPAPVCPIGTSLRTITWEITNGELRDLETPREQCYGSSLVPYTCPNGYEPTRESGGGTLGRPCRRVGGSETVQPICQSGYVYNDELGECETSPVDPSCPGGYQLREGKCMRRRVAAATTTGGSSTSMQGPTSGGAASRLRQVFGPQFTERGNVVSNGGDGDSSQTNVYPELLGGMIDSSSRIPGAGITRPSKNWTLANNGSLPSSMSMGADQMSRYFPFSRTPGDMDVVPDPYRVAQTFSASSYASKTEPVPFLTDFSAFLK
jgi:hypothetical protein